MASGIDTTLELAVASGLEIETQQRVPWSLDDFSYEVDAEPDGCGGWDFRIGWCCATFAQLLGRSPEELVGAGLEDVVAEGDLEAVRARMRTALRTGRTQRVMNLAEIDGRRRTAELTTTPVRTWDGGRRLVTVGRDVTRAAEHAEAMARGRARLETVFAQSPDMIAMVGEDGTFLYVNAAFARVLGFDPVHLIGTSLVALLDPSGGVLLSDLSCVGVGELLPVRMRTATGHWREADISLAPANCEGPPSECEGYVLIARDMSAARRASRLLDSRRSQLAAVVDFGMFALRTPDVTDVLQQGLDMIVDVLKTPYAVVVRGVPEGIELLMANGLEVLGPPGTVLGLPEGAPARAVLGARGPVVVPDWASETRYVLAEELSTMGIRASITCAVFDGDRVWGLVSAHDRVPRDFSTFDADFVQAIANVVASALERARGELPALLRFDAADG